MDLVPIRISVESPRQDEVATLLRDLDAYLNRLYPAESNHLLDIAVLDEPNAHFVVALHNERAVGCGALIIHASGYGEVKRMYVDPRFRGQKIGKRLLTALEEHARRAGLRYMRLETGLCQAEAVALDTGAGFVERGPFGAYPSDPFSVFMEKALFS